MAAKRLTKRDSAFRVYVFDRGGNLCGRDGAGGGRASARSFKAISPGMLPPASIIFGLFVAFNAAQVWTDNERAHRAVNRETSALRAVVILAASFPVAHARPDPSLH
jgi:hypothetical protein